MQTLAIFIQEPYKERTLVPVSFLRVNESGLLNFVLRHIMTSDSYTCKYIDYHLAYQIAYQQGKKLLVREYKDLIPPIILFLLVNY